MHPPAGWSEDRQRPRFQMSPRSRPPSASHTRLSLLTNCKNLSLLTRIWLNASSPLRRASVESKESNWPHFLQPRLAFADYGPANDPTATPLLLPSCGTRPLRASTARSRDSEDPLLPDTATRCRQLSAIASDGARCRRAALQQRSGSPSAAACGRRPPARGSRCRSSTVPPFLASVPSRSHGASRTSFTRRTYALLTLCSAHAATPSSRTASRRSSLRVPSRSSLMTAGCSLWKRSSNGSALRSSSGNRREIQRHNHLRDAHHALPPVPQLSADAGALTQGD